MEEIAQRFAVDDHSPRLPSEASELRRRTVEIRSHGARSNPVLASDFIRDGCRARYASPRRRREQLHRTDKRHATVRRGIEPADQFQGALCGFRSVDADDDGAHALRSPDDEYRARGATDHASGHAAHQQAANGAMSAPADHDYIGLK